MERVLRAMVADEAMVILVDAAGDDGGCSD